MLIKKYSVFFLALVLFFGLSIFFATKSRNYKLLLAKQRIDFIIEKGKVNNYIERSKLKLYMDHVQLNTCYLIDQDNASINIKGLITTPKLVFRFTAGYCPPCIDAALASLKILGDTIGQENILIISDFESSRLLKTFIITKHINSPCYICKDFFNFEIENKNDAERIPYYFMVDESLNVYFPFFAEEAKELNAIYLDRIRLMFNNK